METMSFAYRNLIASLLVAAIGVITLGLGIATVWVETNEVLLAAFMAGVAVTYALAEFVHVEEPAPADVTSSHLALHSRGSPCPAWPG